MTKIIGYKPEKMEWADKNTGDVHSVDRVRVNIVDDDVSGVVGMDVQYYMVKKEDFESVFKLKSYDELKPLLGKRCFVILGIDVRTQRAVLNRIEFVN